MDHFTGISQRESDIVCGWNDDLNCFQYRGDIKRFPPLAGNKGRGKNLIKPTKLREHDDIYPPIEEPVYQVSNESQGSADPRPRCCDQYDIPWQDLCLVNQIPLLNSLSSNIGRFDDVIITTVSDDDDEPHNKPGRVLECRVHPSGKQYLLVAWWFNRSMLAKACPKYEHYLTGKWPLKAGFKFILGCQFDVIDSDTVLQKVLNKGYFCTTMVYGGVYHKHEIFSPASDKDENLEIIGISGGSRKRKTELVRQQNLHSLLFGGV
ncbi:hypothetical protein VC83_03543 [Pseudogymnoascus destructans]|uniref:Uncharacterized protein n=1 Tax=Pseudogymnoascus destructans TaxID=655981 RepID=A0A177AGN8_9PEZI|nr:uncharacterized protein VC83_03543 [Pseudogymnoascus destructans]OAF60343.1 hypothetical protein VC83_03543 [Pseudogymnoascus destructans]